MRFTHLRGVQKAVLEKFERPLPGPVKYAKKKKPSKKAAAVEDGEVQGTKRSWEEIEEEEEVEEQDDSGDMISLLLKAAKQNGDLME